MRVFILGAGKVGRALAHAIRKAGWQATLRPARRGPPARRIAADLLVLAVRDRDLGPLAQRLVDSGSVDRKTACVHVAGALGPEPLAPLRPVSLGIAQMHPMISFASTSSYPSLTGGNMHIQGDKLAVRRARALAKRLGMTPRTILRLDTVGYHAAAGLAANGTAALAAVASDLLVASGVSQQEAPKLLAPLLRSVAENVGSLGFPAALTGPVRRGDVGALERQVALLRARVPHALPVFLATVSAQLPMARAISDAPPDAFDAIEAFLSRETRN